MVKKKLVGDRTEEYGRVRDYATTLLEHNPGKHHGCSRRSNFKPITTEVLKTIRLLGGVCEWFEKWF